MMSLATFAQSLLLSTGARCAALWSAAWTSLDYKGRHAGSIAQSTAGLWCGNMCREWSSCVTSRHRTPAAAWTSQTNERRSPIGSCDWPSPVVSGRFWRPVSRGGGEGAAAYQTKEYTPPGLACVGREVEESVQHCAKTVFYLQRSRLRSSGEED